MTNKWGPNLSKWFLNGDKWLGKSDYLIVWNTLNGPKLFLDVFKWLLYGPIGFEAGEQGFFYLIYNKLWYFVPTSI